VARVVRTNYPNKHENLYGIKNIQIIISSSYNHNRIAGFWITTAEVYPFVAHTFHTLPVSRPKVITVGEVGYELSLYFPWLHVAAYDLYFVGFGD